MKKVCVVTGTRAEYGLLRRVMQGILESADLRLQLIATGMHLSPEFGLTYREIEEDGFVIDRKLEMLQSSDTSIGVTKSMGIAMIGFADALSDLQPDILLLLGDRYEIFCAAAAAMISRIPIAHLHGGETTEGAFDEAIRHSITKMSHIHFVAAEEYRKRVIQLGELPERVHLVGGLGVDNINMMKLLDREALEESLDFKFGQKNILVTFHPVTLEQGTVTGQMKELLKALESLTETHVIFTMPNADTDSRVLIQMIESYVKQHPLTSKSFTSLGQMRYLSCLRHVDAVVGNSSSGLLEVPSFKKATINIGDRQRGRIQALSVIDCAPESSEILSALDHAYSDAFQRVLDHVVNPYGIGGASAKIVTELESCDISVVLKKTFYDLPFPSTYRL